MSDPIFIRISDDVFVDRSKIESVSDYVGTDEAGDSFDGFMVTMDSGAKFYIEPTEPTAAEEFLRRRVLHRSNGEVIT